MYGWWGWRGQDCVSLYPSRHTTVTLYNNNTTSHTNTDFANFREAEECLYFPTCISESSILKQQYKSQDVQVSTKTGNIYDVYFLLGLFLLLRLMLLLLSGGVWGSGRVFLWKPMTGCRVQGASTVWAANTSCYELWPKEAKYDVGSNMPHRAWGPSWASPVWAARWRGGRDRGRGRDRPLCCSTS